MEDFAPFGTFGCAGPPTSSVGLLFLAASPAVVFLPPILTLVDFSDLASYELIGGFDIVKGERVKIRGYLEDFALSQNEADDLIMSARNKIYKD